MFCSYNYDRFASTLKPRIYVGDPINVAWTQASYNWFQWNSVQSLMICKILEGILQILKINFVKLKR